MENFPSLVEQKQLVYSNEDLIQLALDFASRSSSVNTKRTYKHGWSSFQAWCDERGVDPLLSVNKEALISFYITAIAASGNLKVSSITCYLAGIRWHYHDKGIIVLVINVAIH